MEFAFINSTTIESTDNMNNYLKALLISTPLLWSVGTSAGVILSADSVVNNTLGTFAGESIDRVSDGSGLPAFISGVTDFGTYMAANPVHAGFSSANAWASQSGVLTGVIDFFLGGTLSIETLALWSQGSIGQEINSFSIFTSLDSTFASSTAVGTFNGAQTQAGQAFDLVDSVGSYVRLQVNSNYGASCCTTLGEIAFDVNSSTAVPAPATLALLGLGLAGLGWSRRKKA